MTSITLRLQKHLERETTTTGAVASLQRVADQTGAAIRGGLRLDVTIPANNDGDAKLVDVDPGLWLVEATLPSGEILNEEVTVLEGQQVPVTLRTAQRSPREWLGWQHLIGNIEGAETLEQIQERARDLAFSATTGSLTKELGQSLVKGTAGQGSLLSRGTVRSNVPSLEHEQDVSRAPVVLTADAGEPIVGLYEGLTTLRGAAAWNEILDLGQRSSKVCTSFQGSLEEELYLYRFFGPARPSDRVFAHVAWGGERFVVALPVPWMHTVDHAMVPVEMMVRLHPLEKALNIGVAVLDSEFGTLTGLMTASTMPKAKIVVEQAYKLLFNKRSNPLAAAAGGYIMLATGGSKEHSEWQNWIENLQGWFPDLPDGAVLKASLLLLYPKNESSYDEARATLFRAFDRGLPYFSAGIARLLDGLTLFAADFPEAREKMTLVQRVAQRLDLSQAFTVIRLSDKARRA